MTNLRFDVIFLALLSKSSPPPIYLAVFSNKTTITNYHNSKQIKKNWIQELLTTCQDILNSHLTNLQFDNNFTSFDNNFAFTTFLSNSCIKNKQAIIKATQRKSTKVELKSRKLNITSFSKSILLINSLTSFSSRCLVKVPFSIFYSVFVKKEKLHPRKSMKTEFKNPSSKHICSIFGLTSFFSSFPSKAVTPLIPKGSFFIKN